MKEVEMIELATELPWKISTFVTGDIEDAQGRQIANFYGDVDERGADGEWTDTWDRNIKYFIHSANAYPALMEDRARLLEMLTDWMSARDELIGCLHERGALEQWDDEAINAAWLVETNEYENARTLLAELKETP